MPIVEISSAYQEQNIAFDVFANTINVKPPTTHDGNRVAGPSRCAVTGRTGRINRAPWGEGSIAVAPGIGGDAPTGLSFQILEGNLDADEAMVPLKAPAFTEADLPLLLPLTNGARYYEINITALGGGSISAESHHVLYS